MKLKNILKLVFAVLFCQAAGFVGSLFTAPAISTWYASLTKPILNPPNWVFAPVWTILYFLMGVAAFLIWRRGCRRKDVRAALGIFFVQLILNSFWSFIFFGLHSPSGALVEIIFLWLFIFLTIAVFMRISKFAAVLLLPYILWVSFAAWLNYSIWQLNL